MGLMSCFIPSYVYCLEWWVDVRAWHSQMAVNIFVNLHKRSKSHRLQWIIIKIAISWTGNLWSINTTVQLTQRLKINGSLVWPIDHRKMLILIRIRFWHQLYSEPQINFDLASCSYQSNRTFFWYCDACWLCASRGFASDSSNCFLRVDILR